jgi:hypothetical protein
LINHSRCSRLFLIPLLNGCNWGLRWLHSAIPARVCEVFYDTLYL